MSHDSYFLSADKVEGPTTAGLMAYFYSSFESCWDYTHNMLDRGFSLRRFIDNVRPDFTWMYNQPEPAHLSQVPDAIREQYRLFLAEELAEHWGCDVEKVLTTYSDYQAAQEVYDMYVDSLSIKDEEVEA